MEKQQSEREQKFVHYYRPRPVDLILAVRAKNAAEITRLVNECKVNINQHVRGTTALSVAIYEQNVGIAMQLIELGANVNLMSKDHNERLEPPLCSACRMGSEPLVKVLLSALADANKSDFYNHSPLLLATRSCRIDLVTTLLNYGAKVNIAKCWSECPLFLSCKYLGYKGRHEILRLLVNSGISLNLSDDYGKTPLYWALKNLDKNVSRALILCGASVNPLTWCALDRELGIDIKDDEEYYKWLRNELNRPYPLQRQCLRFIRSYLCSDTAKDFTVKVNCLPLPNTLIRYLLLDFLAEEDFRRRE
ncbi:hypothetical protein CHUAL_005304 [Chamberlinius hualienensis]